MGARNTDYPLHPNSESSESPALREANSPQTHALVPEPLSSKKTTSPTNEQPVSSIKQLQSLFEREKAPQPIPVTPNKKTQTSPLNGEHTSSMKQLQSLFEKEQVLQPVPVTSGNKTSTSPLKGEHSLTLKEEGETILLPTLATSGTKTPTNPLKVEPSIILIEKNETVLLPTPVTSGNMPATPPLQVEHANTIKQLQSLFKRESAAPPDYFTRNMSPTSPMNEEGTASPKDGGECIPQPASAMSNDKTSPPLVNGESAEFLKEPNSSRESLVFVDHPLSPLANQELILELKKGKSLRATHQTRGLTTVFTGNSKFNRRISLERAEAARGSLERDGPLPLSPSRSDPNDQSRPPLNTHQST